MSPEDIQRIVETGVENAMTRHMAAHMEKFCLPQHDRLTRQECASAQATRELEALWKKADNASVARVEDIIHAAETAAKVASERAVKSVSSIVNGRGGAMDWKDIKWLAVVVMITVSALASLVGAIKPEDGKPDRATVEKLDRLMKLIDSPAGHSRALMYVPPPASPTTTTLAP